MNDPDREALLSENAALRRRLEDAEETLRAVTSGEVDALVVNSELGDRVFTLTGADTVYRTAIENVGEGVITLAPDGMILYSNRYFAHMMHSDLHALVGASVYDFVQPESRDMLAACLSQQSARGEIVLRSREGTPVTSYLATTRLELDSLAICAVVTDLTLQKRNEEIIHSGQLVQSLLEQSPNAVIVCDETGTIIYASTMANKLCGRLVMGLNVDAALSSVTVSGHPLELAAIRAGGLKDATAVTELDGHKTYLLLKYSILPFSAHEPYIVISLTDITARKKAEEVKDDFISLVSHEIRTPLTILIGALGTAMTAGISPEDRDSMLDEAMKGAVSLNHIVDNLIELSRYQADRLTLQRGSFDLVVAVGSLLDRLQPGIADHRLVISVPEGLPPVHADRTRLELVLVNLLSNAVRYSAPGTEVRLAIEQQADRLVISVSDQGVGIPATELERVFQPFLRLENPATPERGLGLGLMVCRRMVEAHGGVIWAESRPGQGSTFSFTLPL